MKKALLLYTFFIASLCYATPFSCNNIDSMIDLMIPAAEITDKICQTACQINQEYAGQELTIIMIMKGAICVTADLIRHLTIPFKLEYVRASSYGHHGTMRGQLRMEGLDSLDIQGRDVLLIDDIFETGNTITRIAEELQIKQPKSIKTLVLLVKDVPRTTNYLPDYVLFNIPDRFVVGYGLDYKELYRGLPDICVFSE